MATLFGHARKTRIVAPDQSDLSNAIGKNIPLGATPKSPVYPPPS
jgi:hypothetical protein